MAQKQPLCRDCRLHLVIKLLDIPLSGTGDALQLGISPVYPPTTYKILLKTFHDKNEHHLTDLYESFKSLRLPIHNS